MLSKLALAAAVALASAQTSNFTLTLLDLGKHPLAQCLDGSPGGFYFSPGSGSGANSYVIHTQGGGWCIDENDCLGRSKTALGSSTSWAPSGCPNGAAPVCTADGGAAGMLSGNPSVNPDMYNWNKVFINYCDGASYAGTVYNPVNVSGSTIYFRGRFILDAIYDELLSTSNTYGMSSAKEVVIKGCSAGGLAVYLHADYLAGRINGVNPATRVVAAPGAGFFLDAPAVSGQYIYTPHYQYVSTMQNVSGSVNDACMAFYGPAGGPNAWKCFMAPYVLPFMKTPAFISNSLVDAWQAGNIMGLPCDPTNPSSNCPQAVLTYFQGFRNWMLGGLSPVLSPGSKHGGFLQTCFVHVVEDVDGSWNGITVAGQTQAQTWAAWYYGRAGNGLAVDGPWNTTGYTGNPTCGRY